LRRLRVAIVYDCLFPWSIGGAERWYRSLAEELTARGHEVVYLTRGTWDTDPGLAFPVVAVSSGGDNPYHSSGRRRVWPTLVFGFGVWRYLRRHRSIDVVHCASFPFFSVFGARVSRGLRRKPALVVDVIEVWPWSYWRSYLGPFLGAVGWLVERIAFRLADDRFTLSVLQGRRLGRVEAQVLPGLFDGSVADQADSTDPEASYVLFVGRLIAEKGSVTLPGAIEMAQRAIPSLRAQIIGDGPERETVQKEIDDRGLRDSIEMRGFVDADALRAALRGAACVVLPSRREGYGLIVMEATAEGTPVITLRHPENAAALLVESDVNGWIVDSLDPQAWGDAIVHAVTRASVAKPAALEWARVHAASANVSSSADLVLATYARLVHER
jgi:glycosyltransferase involved in cell wall biosynthesis